MQKDLSALQNRNCVFGHQNGVSCSHSHPLPFYKPFLTIAYIKPTNLPKNFHSFSALIPYFFWHISVEIENSPFPWKISDFVG